MIGRLVLYPAIGAITSLQEFGILGLIKALRTQLNNSVIFGSHARRLYLYSAAGQMVNFRDVQWHIAAAREQSYQVEGVAFEHAQHYAPIVEDSTT